MQRLANTKKVRNGARGGSKVKSGCLTCKIRHKKCDERKPACSQCTSTGRKCDFLGLSEHFHGSVHLLSAPTGPISNHPRSLAPLAASDIWHFEYFRVVFARQASLHLGSGAWETIIIRTSMTERCILDGIIAIGALSRNLVPSKVLGSSTYLPGSSADYALKKYAMSLHGLNKRLNESPSNWELAVTGGLVFHTIACLRGHNYTAEMHLRSAQAILKNPNTAVTYGTKTMRVDIGDALHALGRLHSTMAWEMNGPVAPLVPASSASLALPPVFSNIDEARDTLNRISGALNGLCWRENKNASRLSSTSSSGQYKAQVLQLLEAWRILFEQSSSSIASAICHGACMNILRMQYESTYIFAYTTSKDAEMAYDRHISRFQQIVELGAQVIAAEAQKSSKLSSKAMPSLNAAVVQPLFFVACKCRDGALRRRAVATLELIDRETMSEARGWVSIARWIMEIEEITVEGTERLCNDIGEACRLQEVDISMDGAAGRCNITGWRREIDGQWEKVSGSVHLQM
ncbi:hypothetical protein S40293_08337 [Stachybotrys chartarum IBT 40293]|nr:hypothetical protein S40293_08337 [Stachybotrys chartarum IBT 40293]